MTAGPGGDLPKYLRVAARIRGQVADGTLRPGEPVPSGAALSRATGFSTLTCRKALRLLIADGVLVHGPSRNARPRVAAPGESPAQRGLAGAARALSGALAAGRRAAGLTQPQLAAMTEVSVTTIGHAETGRLWQSRAFWTRADEALRARGDLLRLHDAYRAAAAPSPARPPGGQAEPAGTAARGAPAGNPGAEGGPGAGEGAAAHGTAARGANGACGTPARPSCVMIVWSDGTITTVQPPDTAGPG